MPFAQLNSLGNVGACGVVDKSKHKIADLPSAAPERENVVLPVQPQNMNGVVKLIVVVIVEELG